MLPIVVQTVLHAAHSGTDCTTCCPGAQHSTGRPPAGSQLAPLSPTHPPTHPPLPHPGLTSALSSPQPTSGCSAYLSSLPTSGSSAHLSSLPTSWFHTPLTPPPPRLPTCHAVLSSPLRSEPLRSSPHLQAFNPPPPHTHTHTHTRCPACHAVLSSPSPSSRGAPKWPAIAWACAPAPPPPPVSGSPTPCAWSTAPGGGGWAERGRPA